MFLSTESFAGTLELIYQWYAANNADAMDHKIENGPYVALIHHDLDSNSDYSSPSNAIFTVPDGKRAVVLKVEPSRTTAVDAGYRGLRLFDTNGNAEIVRRPDAQQSYGVPDGGLDTDGKLPEAVAGAVVELQTWNNGAASRIRGGFAVLFVADVA